MVAWSFNSIERNFNQYAFISGNLGEITDFVLYSGLFLAYDHIKQTVAYKERIGRFNEQLAEVKLEQLRAQLDPHFIFNSLNTLDELIEEDKDIASEYLYEFAELYRMSLHHSGRKTVLLSDELSFAKHYFNLMQKRLPTGFTLTVTNRGNIPNSIIPPFTLQLLVENALLHNQATKSSGVDIEIMVDETLTVVNTLHPLAVPRKGSGTGLSNIVEQYRYLSDKPVQIEEDGNVFKVSLPLLEGCHA